MTFLRIKCVQKGDFLTVLKKMDETKLSFIEDFTTRYGTHVMPLFKYLKTCELREGCIIGVTWSSNGSGINLLETVIAQTLESRE